MKMMLTLVALACLASQALGQTCIQSSFKFDVVCDGVNSCPASDGFMGNGGNACYNCLGEGSCADSTFGPTSEAACLGPNSCAGATFAAGSCCDGNCGISPPPSCDPSATVTGDPMVTGLKGQSFLFVGSHAKWFAAVAEKHLQWNWLLHVFAECENGLMPTYVTSHAFTLFSADGLGEYELEVGVKDVTKYNPGCLAVGGVCLGEGSFEMSINGETITTPGEYKLENGASVRAFNNVGSCQTKRDVHMMHRLKDEEEQLRAVSQQRRLGEEDLATTADIRALDVLEARIHTMEDAEACSAWIAEKRMGRDLFDSTGSWASVYITTPSYAFQIDYRQEVDRCHAHVVDAVMIFSPNDEVVEEWSGVLGETQTLKLDPANGQALKGRDAILDSVHDDDYIVDGPWGTAFPARRS